MCAYSLTLLDLKKAREIELIRALICSLKMSLNCILFREYAVYAPINDIRDFFDV